MQAAGRALRRYPQKEYGYILLPLIVPQKMNFDDFAKTTAFRQVAQTITALSTQDERIAAEFRAIERGRISSGKIVEIDGDVPVGMKIKLGDFVAAISARVWDSVGRANWRSFKEAREFARALGLSSHVEWWKWTTGRLRRTSLPDCRRIFRLHPSVYMSTIGKIGQIGSGIVDELAAGARSRKRAVCSKIEFKVQ